ncbi:hypothetical protein GCM10010300_69870 [Streptomyces olivaceoviridis]|nr:hypothetical protein GCM10010300_69870 [Streptomyces olivaceoviridis]
MRRTARGRGRNDRGERGERREWTERVEPGLSTGMTCLRGVEWGGVTWGLRHRPSAHWRGHAINDVIEKLRT